MSISNTERMRLISCVLLLFSLNSCYVNEACKPNYIGTFIVDTSNLNRRYKEIIQEHNWDSVKLISESNGSYSFDNDDPILKKCEGTWFTSSNNIEGDCFGYIKQNNLSEAVNLYTFRISGSINDSIKFILPFKKVNN